TQSDYVIFTDSKEKQYADFQPHEFVRADDNLGIRYESPQIYTDTVLLLRYNCPAKQCDVACLGWPDLHQHVKRKHGKQMCDLCTRHKKVFTHEHELFTVAQLRKHERYGDYTPGAAEQSGFKGHPECEFCCTRFYGDDELYAHCREKHERCHICDRLNGGRKPQYFLDYNELEKHFRKDHYMCLDRECLEKKFVVFESQMDLKAHQLNEHPNSMSKDARRDARHVDLSVFSEARQAYQPERPSRRQGGGRGRDPNTEPLPVSSAQPMRRDEIAFHRQMAIQSAQSVSTRTFGGQLTPGPSRAPPTHGQRAASASASASASAQSSAPSTPPIQDLSLSNGTSSSGGGGTSTRAATAASPSLREQSRQLAHAGVINRAALMLRNDQSKLAQFKERVSAYRAGKVTPNHMIDGFFALFDTSSAELGKLIKELAELYENDAQRLALLKAWNDWRAINEDYPALPGAGGNLMPNATAGGVGAGGARVLMLKNSAAAGRSAAVRNTMSSAASGAAAFPPLPSTASAKPTAAAPRSTLLRSPSTTNTSTQNYYRGATTASNSASSSRSSSLAPRPGSRVSLADAGGDAFPALPAAPKPNVLMAGLTRGTRRWDSPAPTQSAWSTDPLSAGEGGSESRAADSAAGGKKGKGKKKQVLYHFG
ncbi:hypothetical protein KEM52_001821, partial [Ascosphaera acerosa]